MNNSQAISWSQAKINILGRPKPPDSLELRLDYVKNVLRDDKGNPVDQHEIHDLMQETIYEWEMRGWQYGILSFPFESGKSQQILALATYLSTRTPEIEQYILTADPGLAKKRIRAIRAIFNSQDYRYWCKQNNFDPVQFGYDDTGSREQIILKSMNATGNPSFEGAGILTGGTGMRISRLWLDDICDDNDRKSRATRQHKYDRLTQNFLKRVRLDGMAIGVRTPWHRADANARLIDSRRWAHLMVRIKQDKSGYELKEYAPESIESGVLI